VEVRLNTLLGSIVGEGPLEVNSLHHQCIDGLAPGLRPAAEAPDGVIEAAEATGAFVLGVQWHPEELVHKDPRHRRIFESFVALARKSPRST
jgi:putative glutamine amidotransferase